jgi:hypothetical protein
MTSAINSKRSVISGEMIMAIPQIIFLIAVLFAFVVLIKVYIITQIDVGQVDSNIFINRILLSQGVISYYDEGLDRTYPGIISLEGFQEVSASNPNKLDQEIISYGGDNPILAAKMTLKKEGYADIAAYYNKENFDRWEPKALPDVKGGPGSVKAFQRQRYVLIKDGDDLSPGILDFFIIT